MTDADLDCGTVRELFEVVKSGTQESFVAWQQLALLLLRRSICDDDQVLRCDGWANTRRLSGGWDPASASLQLRNGYWLRLSQTLRIDETDHGPRMKVAECSYQYQTRAETDADGDQETWIFRYDYTRTRPDDDHPPGHLHVRAVAPEGALVGAKYDQLGRIHFPTGRMSLEAVIRLLVEQFGISAKEKDRYHAVLSESERLFLEIAHQPRSNTKPPKAAW